MKKLFCIALTLLMAFSLSISSFAINNSASSEVDAAITAIENELALNNTSVIAELNSMKIRLSNSLSDISDNNEISKINSQISQINEMIVEYQSYQNDTLIIPRGRFHLIYSPAVAAVIAYFNQQGYILSAELLTHAKDNNTLDSSYTPTNGSLVAQSALYSELVSNGITSGSDAFEKTGATVDDDLYYAIHGFSYTKNTSDSTLTITDRYDFAPDDWSDIQGVAVDMMYKAQEAGTIVPYMVNITVAI